MIRKYHLRLIPFYALALLVAYGLKYQYSHAGSDDLIWVLRPTAFLVERISGIPFEKELNTGFVNYDHQVIIAPSCAGVNFMIILFCLSAFYGLSRMKGLISMKIWIGISLVVAYAYTLLVNTIRIIISIYTYETGRFQSLLTAEGLHRVEGILIYFVCLYLFYVLLEKAMGLIKYRGFKEKAIDMKIMSFKKTLTAGLTPIFWYCSVSLGIPILNRAYLGGSSEFIKHSVIVLALCLLVYVLFFIMRISCQGLWIRLRYRRG